MTARIICNLCSIISLYCPLQHYSVVEIITVIVTLVAVTIAEGNVVAETIVNVVFDSKQNACPQQMALCEGATFRVKSQT